MDSWRACAVRPVDWSLLAAAARDGRASPPEPTREDRGFPRSYRLTARKQFQTVYRRGRRVRSSSFSLFGLPNDLAPARV